jgi:hypothetical protein
MKQSTYSKDDAGEAAFAFGIKLPVQEILEDLITSRGWRMTAWNSMLDPTQTPARVIEDMRMGDMLGRTANRQHAIMSLACPQPEQPQAPSAGSAQASDANASLFLVRAKTLPTLYFMEWNYIDFVLSTVGSVSEAARVLDIRRSTLQRKRKKNPPTR